MLLLLLLLFPSGLYHVTNARPHAHTTRALVILLASFRRSWSRRLLCRYRACGTSWTLQIKKDEMGGGGAMSELEAQQQIQLLAMQHAFTAQMVKESRVNNYTQTVHPSYPSRFCFEPERGSVWGQSVDLSRLRVLVGRVGVPSCLRTPQRQALPPCCSSFFRNSAQTLGVARQPSKKITRRECALLETQQNSKSAPGQRLRTEGPPLALLSAALVILQPRTCV